MPRRLMLSLAVAIAALLLGLVLAFLSRTSAPPPADRDRLETGISAPDYETLTRLIEDYIS